MAGNNVLKMTYLPLQTEASGNMLQVAGQLCEFLEDRNLIKQAGSAPKQWALHMVQALQMDASGDHGFICKKLGPHTVVPISIS
jgi:hypothetical protein